MKSKYFRSVALGIVCILITSNSFAQSKVTLRVNLEEGQTYSVTMSTTQDISQTIMGMNQDMEQTIGFTYDMHVLNKDNYGVYDIDMTYTNVKFKVDGPMGSTDYDSDDPNSVPNPQAKAYASLVNQSIGMKMNDKGRITDVNRVEELVDHMIEYFEIPEGPQREQARANMSQEFSSESMTEQLGNLSVVFPDRPLGVGDYWSQIQDIDSGFPLKMTVTYTVTNITSNRVELDVASTINSQGDEAVETNGMQMIYELNGTQNGTMIIDRKTGLPRVTGLTQDISGSVEILPNAQLPDGMNWPITLVSDVSVRMN